MQDASQNLQVLKAELTEDQFLRASAVLVSVRDGASLEDACEAADITRRTWYNWMDKHPLLKQIVSQIKTARVATCKGILYECALKARENPRYQPSLFFLLERELRDEYGPRVMIDREKAEGAARAISNEQLAELTHAAARALVAESTDAVGSLIAGITATATTDEVAGGVESAGAVTL